MSCGRVFAIIFVRLLSRFILFHELAYDLAVKITLSSPLSAGTEMLDVFWKVLIFFKIYFRAT
jgi:hypothetical protein